MNTEKANLHLHTITSDGIHGSLAVLTYAKVRGVEIVSITDHNEITGAIRGERFAKKLGLIYFPGIELMFHVKGKVYELLAYFYDSKALRKFYIDYRFTNGFMPHFSSVQEVIDLIRKHEGAVVSPHPFGRKGIFREERHRDIEVDAIEVVNAFTGERRNDKASEYEQKHEKVRELGASDMHFFLEDINKVYTKITSKKEITKKSFWNCLLGKSNDINFEPVGKSFHKYKIIFQKPLCVVIYTLNTPWLWLKYFVRKNY